MKFVELLKSRDVTIRNRNTTSSKVSKVQCVLLKIAHGTIQINSIELNDTSSANLHNIFNLDLFQRERNVSVIHVYKMSALVDLFKNT